MNQLTQQAALKIIDFAGRKWLENNINKNQIDNITNETLQEYENLKNEIKETNQRAENIEKNTKKIVDIKEKEVNNTSNSENENYSNYAPEMDIEKGCIPCSRAHILGIRGALKEALRFAREDGIKHPEVEKRIDYAAEELITMERFDLSDDKISNSPPEEQKLIRNVKPDIRELRQFLVNQIEGVENLENATDLANSIYQEIKNKSYLESEVS